MAQVGDEKNKDDPDGEEKANGPDSQPTLI